MIQGMGKSRGVVLALVLTLGPAPAQGSPTVSKVTIHAPAFQDGHVFGYGDYVDPAKVAEGVSQFSWSINSKVHTGAFDKMALFHFNKGLASDDEGLKPSAGSTPGTIKLVGGRFGQGAAIEAGDVLSYGMPAAATATADGAITVWVKPLGWDNWSTKKKHYIYAEDRGGGASIKIFYDGARRKLCVTYFGKTGCEPVIWNDGTWHLVALVWNKSKFALFNDGQPITYWLTATQRALKRASAFFVGCDTNSKDPFQGVIDELRMKNAFAGRDEESDEVHEIWRSARQHHSNESMLSLAGLKEGDVLVFKYRPCNAKAQCGPWVASAPVKVQAFDSTLTILATQVKKKTDRRQIGVATYYDDRPLFDTKGEYVFKFPQAKTWDVDQKSPRKLTVDLTTPLLFGSARIAWRPDSLMSPTNTSLDRMVLYFKASGVPVKEVIMHYYCHQSVETYLLSQAQHAKSKGYGVQYWDILNEAEGFYDWQGTGGRVCGKPKNPDGTTPKDHVEIAAAWTNYAASKIRPVDSSAKIGTMIRNNDPSILDHVPEANLDFLDYHPYMFHYFSSSKKNLKDLNAGDVTEIYNNYQGQAERKYQRIKWLRDILDKQYKKKRVELVLTEWNIHQNMSWSESDLTTITNSLLATVAVSSFQAMILLNDDVSISNLFNFSYGGMGAFFSRLGADSGKQQRGSNYHAYELFARYLGDSIVDHQLETTSFDAPGSSVHTPGWENVPSLLVLPSSNRAQGKLYMIIINRHRSQSILLSVTLQGFKPTGKAGIHTLNITPLSKHHGSYKDVLESNFGGVLHPLSGGWKNWYYNGDNIKISDASAPLGQTFKRTFPPHSITAFELKGVFDPGPATDAAVDAGSAGDAVADTAAQGDSTSPPAEDPGCNCRSVQAESASCSPAGPWPILLMIFLLAPRARRRTPR